MRFPWTKNWARGEILAPIRASVLGEALQRPRHAGLDRIVAIKTSKSPYGHVGGTKWL